MFTDERRDKILELLRRDGRVLAKELADLFEMSIDSIRRDLTFMEEKGLLKRTHGGAIPAAQVRNPPAPPSVRYEKGAPHQDAISKLAASFIQEKDSVFIGSSGLHYGMTKFLPDVPFTVVTNCMRIAETLKDRETIDVYLIGGKVKRSGNITDTLANEFLRQFTLDVCFISGGGISKNGVSTATPEVAAITKTAVQVSRRSICLAPHEKLGVDFFAKGCAISDLDIVITDEEANIDAIKELESKGVKVLIAK